VTGLRDTFNEDAELYDRMRPRYPAALFDDLADLAGIGPGCRVLEIGCGTGQATWALAERGCRIVAVERGDRLAALARRRLAGYPSVEVVRASFEEWPLPDEPFDVVFAATSFHWIDPAVRAVKSAEALRPGGALATIATEHITGGTTRFFADAQACYERHDPATPPGLRLLPADAIAPSYTELTGGPFGPAEFRRYEWERPYTAAEYLDLLLTYSGHRALPEPARRGLLGCISSLIEGRYGGRVVKRYLNELRVAHRTGR
jgi:SAM-dependent methyltransferase